MAHTRQLKFSTWEGEMKPVYKSQTLEMLPVERLTKDIILFVSIVYIKAQHRNLRL